MYLILQANPTTHTYIGFLAKQTFLTIYHTYSLLIFPVPLSEDNAPEFSVVILHLHI